MIKSTNTVIMAIVITRLVAILKHVSINVHFARGPSRPKLSDGLGKELNEPSRHAS